MRSQAARSAAVLMLWPKPASNPGARRPQWAATCCLTKSVSPELRRQGSLGETGDRRQCFELLDMARDRVEQQMVGAHRNQFLEPLAHLLGGAVDTRGVGALGVVVNL